MTTPLVLSTQSIPARHRADWLQDVIGREYTKVAVTPPRDQRLFNEMTIFPWDDLRLSSIRSDAIRIERRAGEPLTKDQDSYFAVLLLNGGYMLSQDGRDAVLAPGDIAVYDAARPHRIDADGPFAKMIVSVPRALMRERVPAIDACTATRIPATLGATALAGHFLQSVTAQAALLTDDDFNRLSVLSLDLLTMALAPIRPHRHCLSNPRAMSLRRIKQTIERLLPDADLDAAMIAAAVGVSPRYVRALFADTGTSPMRYVWERRLEKCRAMLERNDFAGWRITEIALSCGFDDLAHFSRSFKLRYGLSPRAWRAADRSHGGWSKSNEKGAG